VERNPGPPFNPRYLDPNTPAPIDNDLLAASDKALLALTEKKGRPLTLEEIIEHLLETYGDRIQPKRKPAPRITVAQSTRKLLNRINRAIRDCKRNGRRGLSQLLKHKHQVIESLRVEKHQRQRKANDDSFAADPYAAYNRVINPPDPTAPQGTKEDAEAFLRSEFSPSPDDDDDGNFQIPAHTPPSGREMTEVTISGDDVATALTGKSPNSAPGYDKITYGVLRCLGPQGRIMLGNLLQDILDNKLDIPSAWTTIRVRMVYKGKRKDVKLWDSFRAICIGSTVGKLLNAVLERKMLQHLRENGLIDENIQKGFLRKISGTTDHIQVINHLAQHIPAGGELHMVLLDLKSAFNSVSHNKLWKVLEHFKIHEKVIKYLKLLYAKTTMRIQSKDVTTDDIPVRRGVLQGCTVSPLLFTMFFMLVINAGKEAARRASVGFKAPVDGTNATLVNHIMKAFADDLTIVDKNLEGARATWAGIAEGLALTGLNVNKTKCCHIVIKGGVKAKVRAATMPNETISLGPNMDIPTGAEAASPFLGCDRVIAPSVKSLKSFLRCKLINTLKTIDEANYCAKAKIFFYKIAVLSKMRWYFMIYECISHTTAENLSALANQFIKKWLQTSKTTTPELITSTARGLGITPLTDIWSRARQVHIANGLRSTDIAVAGACRYRATNPTQFNKTDIEATTALASESPTPKKETINARILAESERKGKERIKKENPSTQWVWAISDENSLLAWKLLLQHCLRRNTIGPFLALASGGASFWSWQNTQGTTRQSFGRLVRGTNCIFCGRESAPVSHFLSFCHNRTSLDRYTHRHNKVVATILEHVLSYAKLPVIRGVWADLAGGPLTPGDCIPGWTSHFKPDIVIDWLDSYGRARLSVIEVTCPFETHDLKHLNQRHLEKAGKYSQLLAELNSPQRRPHRLQANLHVLVVGTRGYVHPEFFSPSFAKIFQEDDTRDAHVRRLAHECAKNSLEGSLNIIRARNMTDFPYATPRYPYELTNRVINPDPPTPSSVPPSPLASPRRGTPSTPPASSSNSSTNSIATSSTLSPTSSDTSDTHTSDSLLTSLRSHDSASTTDSTDSDTSDTSTATSEDESSSSTTTATSSDVQAPSLLTSRPKTVPQPPTPAKKQHLAPTRRKILPTPGTAKSRKR